MDDDNAVPDVPPARRTSCSSGLSKDQLPILGLTVNAPSAAAAAAAQMSAANQALAQMRLGLNSLFFGELYTHEQRIAVLSMASITRSTMAPSTAASIFTLGRKSTTYSAPR